MYQFSFEKLDVWNEARYLTKELYTRTKTFPESEKFGLVNQIRRAAVSVCSNIAEGSSRRYLKEQIMFYQIAYSSLMEVMNQVIISTDLDYLDDNSQKSLRERILKISRMRNGLRNSQKIPD
ncbi:MAG: four helix bundle protein [Nitrospirae bacterium RBG_13_41_22]|nr:MAG: four helix bundle protein [Nitrospirae bacterium RBG_13_41_22]